jgi:hypothetical protein
MDSGLLQVVGRIDHAARHGAGGGCKRTGEHGTAARSLAALEITVAGTDHQLTIARQIAVHRDAHGTTRLTPLGAGRKKHPIQAFRFRAATGFH